MTLHTQCVFQHRNITPWHACPDMASNKILHSVMRFAKSAGFKTFRIEIYSELQGHSASSNKQQKDSWLTSDSANDSSTTFSILLSSSVFKCISTRWKIMTIYKHLLTTYGTSTTICEYHLIYHHRIYRIVFMSHSFIWPHQISASSCRTSSSASLRARATWSTMDTEQYGTTHGLSDKMK